jgi:multiple sugar transport system ATP-binding protein
MGSHLLLTGHVGDDLARVVAPSSTRIDAGAMLGLALDPARIVWIDPQTGRTHPGA